MAAKVLWSDSVPEKDGVKSSVNDVAISPDGTRALVAVGKLVLLYSAENGDLLESLRGHKDTVYCVDFSSDGTRFASGGADNVVVIWKTTPQGGQGVLKFTHTAPIQRVKYNPVKVQLASCSDVDFGFWTPDQKQVVKEKVASRILAASWSSDGALLALGLVSGVISVRNQKGEEVHRVERKAPVWCLAFVPSTAPASKVVGANSPAATAGQSGDLEMLAVGCWDKTLSLYKLTAGATPKVQTERALRYYPCSLGLAGSTGSKSHYLIISGSNKKVTLYSKEGIRLAELATKDSWVWGCACQTGSDRVILGADSGAIDLVQMSFEPVHALFKEKYAYRENLTDVVIHHLTGDRKVRIKCKDLIQRISLYKNKLAVQLSDKVCVYESSVDEAMDLHFKARKERMTISDQQCDLMTVTSSHLLFCRANILELYSFDGQRQRVWQMEASICFMKVEGGPDGREGILLGLLNGVVAKLYVDNPFPLELTNIGSPILLADLCQYRTKLATVDSKHTLIVTDLKTHESLMTIQGVLSVSFNSEVDDMLCYTTETSIFVVSGLGVIRSPEPQEQHTTGLAIGFQGHKIFCLLKGSIVTIDVPQSANIERAIEGGDIMGAYRSACLGATEADWKLLAIRSLRLNSLSIAKSSFARLKDTKYLSLIETMEQRTTSSTGQSDASDRRRGGNGDGAGVGLDLSWQAELLAYEGNHQEAAKTYSRAGKVLEAIRLFTDLRKWNEAKMFAQNAGQGDLQYLTMQQAKWLQEINDWKGAAELFLSMGQHLQAAKIVVDSSEPGWQSVLMDVVRACPQENVEAITFCGESFAKSNDDELAREAYEKVGDISKLMSLYAKKQMWTEAAKLADEHEGKFDVSVFLPYAEWLVSQDRYEDAMDAYKKADRRDLSRKVLEELTFNAVSESRFRDAAYYFWMLSKEPDADDPAAQAECERKADLYFAYATVHAYVTDPFTSHQPETLFQVARFIINSLGNAEVIPHGISKASTLYTLARQAMKLGAFKLARHAYDRLGKLQIPARRQGEVELDMLIIQAKPVRDDTDHLPVCYRCSSTNPPLNPFTNKFAKGDVCTSCGHPFVRSFINFDVLPLVEFVPDPSISDEEAMDLIRRPPTGDERRKAGGKSRGNTRPGGRWKESKDGNSDVMSMDSVSSAYADDTGGGENDNDLFARCLNIALESQNNSSYVTVTVDANTLLAMRRSEVYVCRPSSKSKRATFYRNMLPDISIAISQPCHRFFHLEDFESTYLTDKSCPYSRHRAVGEYGSL